MRQRVKRREGTVVRAKMTKTVVVQVDRLVQHPIVWQAGESTLPLDGA